MPKAPCVLAQNAATVLQDPASVTDKGTRGGELERSAAARGCAMQVRGCGDVSTEHSASGSGMRWRILQMHC